MRLFSSINKEGAIQALYKNRSLTLVDVQNIAGSGVFTDQESLNVRSIIRTIVPARKYDQMLVATGPETFLRVGLTWPDAKPLLGRGENGADYALQEQIKDTQWVTDRFDRLYLASGDHEFISEVGAFVSVGFPVTLIGREGSIFGGYKELDIEIVELGNGWGLAA